MTKLALLLVLGSSFSIILFLFLAGYQPTRQISGREANMEDRKLPSVNSAQLVRAVDDFASRRRRLDQECEKYRDMLRPEHYSLYREDILLTNLSTNFFIAGEKQFSGKEKGGIRKPSFILFILCTVDT
jgi:hypothetical protein